MALKLEGKQVIVAEVNEAAKSALSAVVANARGVEVTKMTELRKKAREAGVTVRTVRNTLLRRAVKDTDFEVLTDTFTGPTIVAFSNEHPGAAARIFRDFAKDNKLFEIKGAAFNKEFISAANIDVLASLPTLEEALARLAGTMKEAAAGKLARTLKAVADKKEAEAA
ncbi:50S ribosomal protein L10 [Psittacicella hinzii]|uniref:Large ribosomal subunit protein uL10 n=1 Tax=Psittacicella hinzii TaxID=2028575 RepID=A0A3A1YE64_9GAMM|nr:50S ribosomal protein L10 [Psittacicella hinzii]RIY36462.1 50S ribosomal protein L10 [Psittacicella hinzii]